MGYKRGLDLLFVLLLFQNQMMCNSDWKKKKLVTSGFKNFLRNSADINKNLFSKDSLKVLFGAIPFYIQARTLDPHIHECFYDSLTHTNVCQLCSDDIPEKFDFLAAIPSLFFVPLIFGKSKRKRTIAQIYFTGLPFVLITKNIIKKIIKTDICLRPKNGCFDKTKIHYGGFPSGTTSTAIYTMVFAGMQLGRYFAIPMGFFAGAIAVVYINCNRHFYSQIVAGAALGTIYGIAASKVADEVLKRKKKSFSIGFDVTDKGDPAISLSYRF